MHIIIVNATYTVVLDRGYWEGLSSEEKRSMYNLRSGANYRTLSDIRTWQQDSSSTLSYIHTHKIEFHSENVTRGGETGLTEFLRGQQDKHKGDLESISKGGQELSKGVQMPPPPNETLKN